MHAVAQNCPFKTQFEIWRKKPNEDIINRVLTCPRAEPIIVNAKSRPLCRLELPVG